MFPLSNYLDLKRGYRFGRPTFYNNWHAGVDVIVPTGTPIFAPFTGGAVKSWSWSGGNCISFYPDHLPFVFRFMHLSKFVKLGRVVEGEVMGLSGSSGAYVRGAHVHVEQWRGEVRLRNRAYMLDPDLFDWNLIISAYNYMFARNEQGEIALIYKRKDGVTVRMPVTGDRYKALGEPQFIQVTTAQYNQWLPVGAWL